MNQISVVAMGIGSVKIQRRENAFPLSYEVCAWLLAQVSAGESTTENQAE